MNKIVIYGAGGFGREIACLINAINETEMQWDLLGFIDDGYDIGHTNRYGKVIGNLDTLNAYPEKIAVALAVASPDVLRKLSLEITNKLVWFPNLIAPDVKFHDYDSFSAGQGNIIFFSSRISCDVTIGSFNLLNSLVSLGHDVVVGDCNVFNPTVRISGDSRVGNENFFGIQSIVLQGKIIGNRVKIGVSSVVMRNITKESLYFGNPAKRVKT